MINPDRWLQSFADDTSEDDIEQFDEEFDDVEKGIAKNGIDDSQHDFYDSVFPYQSRIMQAIANGDDVLTLMLIKEVYVQEVNAIVKRNLGL